MKTIKMSKYFKFTLPLPLLSYLNENYIFIIYINLPSSFYFYHIDCVAEGVSAQ